MSELATTPLPPLPARLPVIPLRGTVVFPHTLQPLAVNRPVSVDSVNRALNGDRMVLLVQQAGEIDDPGPDAIRDIGALAGLRLDQALAKLNVEACGGWPAVVTIAVVAIAFQSVTVSARAGAEAASANSAATAASMAAPRT